MAKAFPIVYGRGYGLVGKSETGGIPRLPSAVGKRVSERGNEWPKEEVGSTCVSRAESDSHVRQNYGHH